MRLLVLALSIAAAAAPHVDRVSPLGGQAGSIVEVELIGSGLSGLRGVRFDSPDIEWIETVEAKAESVRGKVRIKPGAALGPHRIQGRTPHGPSNTRLFNVYEFPGVKETEPNDKAPSVQILPPGQQVVYGEMKSLADVDLFSFPAQQGERWLIDLQSIERGGFLECSLSVLDDSGREIAFNEDQDEYLETPRATVVFPRSGRYIIKLDQYRGPQGVSCEKNCGYALVLSQLPSVTGLFPLGTSRGETLQLRLHGEGLQSVTSAYLQRARGAEHYRLTFPYSILVDGTDGPRQRIDARTLSATASSVDAVFPIPANATPGLWRVWLVTPKGTAEAMSIEIDANAGAKDGVLGQTNTYPVALEAGKPFHARTVAAQLGLPFIDTVLELWDESGTLLAEHDDLMTGQGTVIGNPDSSLYYTPKRTQRAKLTVRDRTNRTGPTFAYRLHVTAEEPSFQLLTEPEEFTLSPGTESELEVLLIKQPGFEGAVDVWMEGLPEGLTASTARFRADQQFGPSGDGDNINIPAIHLKLKAAPTLQTGDYRVRVKGKSVDRPGQPIDAIATLWIGPAGKRNDTRRPLPAVTVHVSERN